MVHYRVKFLANEDNAIVGMVVSDAPPKGKVNWKLTMSIKQLEQSLKRFTELINQQSNNISEEMIERAA